MKEWVFILKGKVLAAQSCLGSSVHGILQAKILELVAMPVSRGIFPNQGLNLDLPHCRQILKPLSHQRSHIYLEGRG